MFPSFFAFHEINSKTLVNSSIEPKIVWWCEKTDCTEVKFLVLTSKNLLQPIFSCACSHLRGVKGVLDKKVQESVKRAAYIYFFSFFQTNGSCSHVNSVMYLSLRRLQMHFYSADRWHQWLNWVIDGIFERFLPNSADQFSFLVEVRTELNFITVPLHRSVVFRSDNFELFIQTEWDAYFFERFYLRHFL